jgi:hypothetical protein
MEALAWGLTLYMALVGLLWPLLTLAAWAGARDRRFVLERAAPQSQKDPPLLSVIIPARNEEAVIARAVRSALAQDWPNLEVLVVNDASEDQTHQRALEAGQGDPRLRVVSGRPLPAGWLGKPSACWHGQSLAGGELLLFVDADVELDPQAARRCVEVMQERQLGLVSLWGSWVMDSFWMRVTQPVVGGFVRGAHPLDRCNDPQDPTAFANGQLILTSRQAYARFGGHEAVRDQVLEDVRLAQVAQRSGVKLGMFLAPQLFRVRLYTTLPELWSGMVKNFYHGMDRKPALALLAAAFVAGTTLTPPLTLALGLWWGAPWLVAASLWSLLWMPLYRLWADRGLELPGAYALTHPLGTAVLTGIILTSMWRGVRGRPTVWKGRQVQG